jgi:hypothetical protein
MASPCGTAIVLPVPDAARLASPAVPPAPEASFRRDEAQPPRQRGPAFALPEAPPSPLPLPKPTPPPRPRSRGASSYGRIALGDARMCSKRARARAQRRRVAGYITQKLPRAPGERTSAGKQISPDKAMGLLAQAPLVEAPEPDLASLLVKIPQTRRGAATSVKATSCRATDLQDFVSFSHLDEQSSSEFPEATPREMSSWQLTTFSLRRPSPCASASISTIYFPRQVFSSSWTAGREHRSSMPSPPFGGFYPAFRLSRSPRCA